MDTILVKVSYGTEMERNALARLCLLFSAPRHKQTVCGLVLVINFPRVCVCVCVTSEFTVFWVCQQTRVPRLTYTDVCHLHTHTLKHRIRKHIFPMQSGCNVTTQTHLSFEWLVLGVLSDSAVCQVRIFFKMNYVCWESGWPMSTNVFCLCDLSIISQKMLL